MDCLRETVVLSAHCENTGVIIEKTCQMIDYYDCLEELKRAAKQQGKYTLYRKIDNNHYVKI